MRCDVLQNGGDVTHHATQCGKIFHQADNHDIAPHLFAISWAVNLQFSHLRLWLVAEANNSKKKKRKNLPGYFLVLSSFSAFGFFTKYSSKGISRWSGLTKSSWYCNLYHARCKPAKPANTRPMWRPTLSPLIMMFRSSEKKIDHVELIFLACSKLIAFRVFCPKERQLLVPQETRI